MAKSKIEKEKEAIKEFEEATERKEEKEVPSVVESPKREIPRRPALPNRPLGVGTFNDLVQEVAWLRVRLEALENA